MPGGRGRPAPLEAIGKIGKEVDVPSTVIRSIGYRAETRELDILFTTGRRYLFHDVPPEVAEDFQRARIKGRHFNSRIRGRYRFSEAWPD